MGFRTSERVHYIPILEMLPFLLSFLLSVLAFPLVFVIPTNTVYSIAYFAWYCILDLGMYRTHDARLHIGSMLFVLDILLAINADMYEVMLAWILLRSTSIGLRTLQGICVYLKNI